MKMFDKWELEEVKVEDKGLKRYINLETILVPRTGGRRTKVRFHKNYTNIVERLMNKLKI